MKGKGKKVRMYTEGKRESRIKKVQIGDDEREGVDLDGAGKALKKPGGPAINVLA